MNGKVLIVDDQQHVLDALELLFEIRGISVVCVRDPDAALEMIRSREIWVVIQDMNFSHATTTGEEGTALFQAIREIEPQMPIILMTAWASLQTAVQLVKQGADDYLQKPWDDDVLLRKVQNLIKIRQLRNSSTPGSDEFDYCGLLFRSAAMKSVVSLATKVASADVPVLITGPNGCGKEKLAEIIQANSTRRQAPFIKVNVGALPDELFAAELFGAEAGAFTGAKSRRLGRFEAADKGTLLLDEIGNLSTESQAKLLRALQSGEFERLGSSETRRADVRLIAATNVDMRASICDGRFREDLYYRLAVIELEIPPLEKRAEDIQLLAEAFINSYAKESELEVIPKLSPECLHVMQGYCWPGNVRELQNRIQRALLVYEGPILKAEHLGLKKSASAATDMDNNCNASALTPLEQKEREAIELALRKADYIVSRAARSLGLSRQALYRRMQRLNMQLKRDVD